MKARSLLFTVTTLGVLLASAADLRAQDHEPFTPERFAALQADGAWILLDVHADWCPTCARQQEILGEFRERWPDAAVHFLRIDFDTQKEHVIRFRAPRQSTLILYRGEERVWFSVAETDPEVILGALAPTRAGARP